jgi:hypothetical protein
LQTDDLAGSIIKRGINSAWVLSQVVTIRKYRVHRAFAIVNFALAGLYAASAYHNYGVARLR